MASQRADGTSTPVRGKRSHCRAAVQAGGGVAARRPSAVPSLVSASRRCKVWRPICGPGIGEDRIGVGAISPRARLSANSRRRDDSSHRRERSPAWALPVRYDLFTTDIPGAVSFYTRSSGGGRHRGKAVPRPTRCGTTLDKNSTIGGVGTLDADAVKTGATPLLAGVRRSAQRRRNAKLAAALGGSVSAPTDIPTVGRFSMLKDPQGARFAAFTALSVWPGHDGPARMREFAWHRFGTFRRIGGLRVLPNAFRVEQAAGP